MTTASGSMRSNPMPATRKRPRLPVQDVAHGQRGQAVADRLQLLVVAVVDAVEEPEEQLVGVGEVPAESDRNLPDPGDLLALGDDRLHGDDGDLHDFLSIVATCFGLTMTSIGAMPTTE
jgi:hypothetical protein